MAPRSNPRMAALGDIGELAEKLKGDRRAGKNDAWNEARGMNEIRVITAAQALEEQKARLKLTTGDGGLDGLIGGIEEGLLHLFYGEGEVLAGLAYRLLVNCVLPVERGGFGAKAIYFNNTDYYSDKAVLDPSEIGGLAKHMGVDPKVVFRNVSVAAAYNERRQLIVARKLAELMEGDHGIRLLLAHNLTRFLADSKRPQQTREILKQVLGTLWGTASKRRIAMIVTGEAMSTGRGFVPRPVGGNFFRHVAGVILHLRTFRDGPISSVKATLIKHPYKRAPDSCILLVSKGGVDLMGRITPSFRQLYEEAVAELKTCYQSSLVDLSHKQAFDLLLKEAWNAEQAAMGNSNLPTVVDRLNLTANIHNRRQIEALKKKLEERDRIMERLVREVEELKARNAGGAADGK